MLLLASLRPLLDDLLSLGVDLLVVDLAGGFALLALGLLGGLNADGGGAAGADLLLGLVPGGATVVDLVSGGCEISYCSFRGCGC